MSHNKTPDKIVASIIEDYRGHHSIEMSGMRFHLSAATLWRITKHHYDSIRSDLADNFIKENEELRIHVCSHFGCGKHLSLIEQLCGSRCTKHSIGQTN